MNKPSDNNSNNLPNNTEEQINITPEGDVGEALEKGMDALKSVFGGIVDMVQDTIGPDGMKNLGAGQWLTQVATCLQEAADGLSSGAVPAGKAGEVSCFLDRLEEELTGSKFDAQVSSMREKLQQAQQAIESADGSDPSGVAAIADAAGYFNAAASSIFSTGGSVSSS